MVQTTWMGIQDASTCFQHLPQIFCSSNATASLLAVTSLNMSLSFFCGAFGSAHIDGFNKSNPVVLSMAVRWSWSMTILLCFRNGSPNITGLHRFGATIAHTVQAEYSPVLSWRDKCTYSVRITETFSFLFCNVSSISIGDGNF